MRTEVMLFVVLAACSCSSTDEPGGEPIFSSAPARPSTPDVANGLMREEAAATRTPEEQAIHAEFLAIAKGLDASNAIFVSGSRERILRRHLQDAELATREGIDKRILLAQELLRVGKNASALREFEEALRLEKELYNKDTVNNPARQPKNEERLKKLLFRLVIANMRAGEQDNCVARHHPLSCILPLRDGGVHADRAKAKTAMSYALQYLGLAPDDIKGIWFLNVAAMAAGLHPDGVPDRWRIPPTAFHSQVDVGHYPDVAPVLGINTFDQAGGSITEDFDGDGFIDILTSTMDPKGALTYFRNSGDGRFINLTRQARLDTQLGGLNMIQTDFDNNGRPDILILRGGWLMHQGRIRNSLLRNNDDGTFTDITRASGLAEPALPTQAAGWADYDNDGDLDLFVGNEGEEGDDGMVFFADNLYRNNGDGTFTDVAREAGVRNVRFVKGVAWGDYDGDNDPDLYVSNIGPNRLYRNNGDGTFTDVAPELGITAPESRSFATWFFDYDNDGDLDLFVACYLAEMVDIAADIMGRTDDKPELWPRLYRNDGGSFTDVTIRAGLDHASLPMGANYGDINEDGYPDIYLGTGAPPYEAFMPNVMYLNNRDGTFTDVTFSGGFGHLQKGHGISFADLDNDGDADVALQVGGMFPGDAFGNVLFENPGHGHRFLTVKAVGRRSNRIALGTRIHVRVATPSGERSIYRWVTSGGSFGASPLEQCIGLGDAVRIVSLELKWPASGLLQRFTDVPLDTHLRVVEGEEHFAIVERPRLRLGATTGERGETRKSTRVESAIYGP